MDSVLFTEWLDQADALGFLAANANHSHIVLYAGLGSFFLFSATIPRAVADAAEDDDLLRWNGNAASSWSYWTGKDGSGVEPPLTSIGSTAISAGDPLVIYRSFDEFPEIGSYLEPWQKLTHLLGIHYVPERQAWCSIDRRGNLEDVLSVHRVPTLAGGVDGTVFLGRRDRLAEYAGMTDSVLVRMFDSTRLKTGAFTIWESHEHAKRDPSSGCVYRFGRGPHASYVRGVQVIDLGDYDPRSWFASETRFQTFIACDWKRGEIGELSCDPAELDSYFEDSGKPWEISPAFFHPEVLLKYKADREKYTLATRNINCRGSWHIQTYDINEQGQVHTYLRYLGQLPYEEQLHWRQFNEHPRGDISARARRTDIDGSFDVTIDPLMRIKMTLQNWRTKRLPWWSLRGAKLVDRAQYVVTTSSDEWGDELKNLDQLVVEGFEERWLRAALKERGDADPRLRSLRLIERLLLSDDFDAERAAAIVAPLNVLHRLRSLVSGHASGETATSERRAAISAHGSLRNHYIQLCEEVADALEVLTEVLSQISVSGSSS